MMVGQSLECSSQINRNQVAIGGVQADILLTFVLSTITGKFLPYVGNQIEFPVPPGILNYSGDNIVGLSIWNLNDEAHASVSVGMKVLGVYASAVDTAGLDTAYLRPGWEESRLQYV